MTGGETGSMSASYRQWRLACPPRHSAETRPLQRRMPLRTLRRSLEQVPLHFVRFDAHTSECRAKERVRRVGLTAAASALARITTIATSLLTAPMTLHYLGAERYGLWMTLSSVTAMLSFADFGIGNGVLSAVATAHGRDDLSGIRGYISSAFALLMAIGVGVLVLMAALYGVVDWAALFNVTLPVTKSEVAPAAAIFVACFAIALPLGIVQRVQLGSQMGFMASLWQCLASLAGLGGVLFAIYFRAGLPWLVLGYAGLPVFVGLINSMVFFGRLYPEFRPRPNAVSRHHSAEIAQVGFLFFILQIAVSVTYASDNFVIAHILGAEKVTQFAIPDRLFALTSMVVGLAVTPLWPAFGEAIARGDNVWARQTLLRTTVVAGLAGIAASMFLLIFGKTIIHAWVGDTIQPTFALLAGFAVWRALEAFVGPGSMYLNGLRAFRFQVITAIITAFVVIGLEIALIRRVGIAGLPWITTFGYFCLTFVPGFLFLRGKLSSAPAPVV